MRGTFAAGLAFAALYCGTVAIPVEAQLAQSILDGILHTDKPSDVMAMRSACARGHAPRLSAEARSIGLEQPDASVLCITVLTRQARDGTLGYVRDPGSGPTPALAFDSGFVGGYAKHEAPPVGAPTMATLLPIAERCLGQREADNALCNAAGQITGMRVAQGEIVAAR